MIIQGGGAIAFGSASVIASQGLIVAPIDENLSDSEKVTAMELQLEINRANCEGMDRAAAALTSLLDSATIVCFDKFDDDCDQITDVSIALVTKITTLIQLSSENIELSSIATLSLEIITFISSNTITIISYDQLVVIESIIQTLRFNVLIYVSQISVIESKKLEISGALQFAGVTITIEEVDKEDIELQISVLEVQLTNLFQIADANDKVLECIVNIEGLPASSNPQPNPEFSANVERIPGMCGAPAPPVKEIQTTAASITALCSELTEQPTEFELNTLLFIKQSLITFKQTFSSQITIFSQKLSVLTGTIISAASLEVQVISSTGTLELATGVDTSGGFTIGTVDFYLYRIGVLKSVLNAVVSVIQKITVVLSLSSEGTGETMESSESFALLISSFFDSISSGFITIDVVTIAQSIIQTEISSLPSNLIIILLETLETSLQSIQLTILSQISTTTVLLFQEVTSFSEIVFTVQSFDETGNLITSIESAQNIESSTEEELQALVEIVQVIQLNFVNIVELTEAALSLDFGSITTAVTEVSSEVFVNKIIDILIVFGQYFGSTSTEVNRRLDIPMVFDQNSASTIISTLVTELLEFKITSLLQAQQYKIEFILYTVQTYLTQMDSEILLIQQSNSEEGGSSEKPGPAPTPAPGPAPAPVTPGPPGPSPSPVPPGPAPSPVPSPPGPSPSPVPSPPGPSPPPPPPPSSCCETKMEYNDDGSVKHFYVLSKTANEEMQAGCNDGCVYIR